MLCQNCKINESTIHLYTNVNGRQQQVDLCQNCYKIMKTDPNNSFLKGMTQRSQLTGDPFEDFFNNLGNFQSPQEPQTPPTQSGGSYGGGGYGQNNNRGGGQDPRQARPQKPKGLLEEFGINVTEIARKGDIDPVIGRDEEIIRVIEILNRRTKNNPVLIGEPGVGKTAVVEGLAQKIVDGDVPHKLQGKEVIRLDVVSLVQGTGIRGQFEERMQKLMDEIRQREDVILFIDEIHEIVGAGSAGEGNMDAGNILKPALARGELQLVGATTLNEYRIIEKDAALERRMQPVKVDEPTVEETITILKGIQKKYEDYHHVHYTDGAIEAAAILSNRYIQDRFLPDKAIDLLDEAGSKMNLTLNFVDPKVIDQRLIEAENLKAQATREEDFEKAAYFRDQIAKYKEMQGQHVTDQETPVISEKTIEHIVEQKTNIPVGDLKEKEQSQLINLASDLKAHVIGQDDAVDKIAKAIDDPELIQELYDATGYSSKKIRERKKIIADNGFSLDLSTVQVHEKFFSTLMRGLSMMTSLHKVEWTIKSGTPRSYDYLIELKEGNIDYWYIRYVDRITSDEERKKALTAIYGEFAKLKLGGKIKVSCATPSYEDYDYFVTIPPYQLNTNASIIHFDSELERFADETFLETALPLKENIPVKDFCNLTESLIL